MISRMFRLHMNADNNLYDLLAPCKLEVVLAFCGSDSK
jgi:hypothetical protein